MVPTIKKQSIKNRYRTNYKLNIERNHRNLFNAVKVGNIFFKSLNIIYLK